MSENIIVNIIGNFISNSLFIGLLIWIGMSQIKRIDGHDDNIKKILEIIAQTQKDIAVLIERTKHI